MFQLPPDSQLSKQSRAKKIDIARKIGMFLSKEQNEKERETAEELASQLLADSSVSVRQAFSEAVLTCPFLSKDMARTIADDLTEVSEPFILNSEGVDTDMLEYIARECNEAAREVLATRDGLPESVSYAISEVGQETAVENLMGNKTAEVSERVCSNVTDRFPDNMAIITKMVDRDDLPLTVIEVLVKRVSADLMKNISEKYGIGADFAAYIGGEAELEVMRRALQKASGSEVRSFLKLQMAKGKLEGPVVLQMLKSGDLKLFKWSIALRAKMGISDVDSLLYDGSDGAFKILLHKAGLNDGMARLFRTTYEETMRKIEQEKAS